MFLLKTTPLEDDIAKYKSIYNSTASGSILEFSGQVRNHNEGRDVVRLEYSSYQELAEKEGLRILESIREEFHLQAIFALHRIGSLELGDLALYIAIYAKHRTESFNAMDKAITEIKKSVPIWKKEFYKDENSWL